MLDLLQRLGLGAIAVFVAYRLVLWLLTPRPMSTIPHYPVKSGGDMREFVKHVAAHQTLTPFFDQACRDLGPIAQVMMGPLQNLLLISDMQEIEDICVRRTKEFERADLSTVVFKTTMPTGLISLKTDDTFRRHKRVMMPAMSSTYLSNFTPRITNCIQDLLRLIDVQRQLAGDSPFSIKDAINSSILDITSAVTWGETLENTTTSIATARGLDRAPAPDARGGIFFPSEHTPLASDIDYLFATFGQITTSAVPTIASFFLRLRPRWRRAHKNVFAYLKRRALAAREEMETRSLDGEVADTVLDMVIAKEQQSASNHMALNELQDELLVFIVGGSETTAVSVSWAIKYLSRHPDVQRRIRAEVTAQLPSLDERAPTFAEIQSDSMPYLDAFVYEVLRMSRTAGGAARQTTCETTLLGHVVPKGTNCILLTAGAMSTDESNGAGRSDPDDAIRSESSRKHGRKFGHFGKDVHKFEPARWLRDDGTFDPNAGPWLPFSAGPRGCYGKALAMLELKLFTALISLSFFLDTIPPELDGDASKEVVTNSPVNVFIRPRKW